MSKLPEVLSRLKHAEFNSSLVRRTLSMYYREGRPYRLPFGPLRGTRLHYDRSVNFHVVLGLWESKSYAFLSRLLKEGRIITPGFTVADVGANLGYFSLWMARQIRPVCGKVYAFEPSPTIVPTFRKNLALNPGEPIELVEQACSDHVGTVEFFIGAHHHISSVDGAWASDGRNDSKKIVVKATTIDAFFDEATGRPAPDFIKVDIEGGGVYALKGIDRVVARKRPLIWMESHNPAEDRAISDFVHKNGYGAFRSRDDKEVTKLDETYPHPEGIFGTLLLYPKERRDQLLPVLR